jgi:uncharacterized LabA/DUF88 family protein
VSKNVAVFVDVANLYYSARGQEVDVDYVALLKAATKGRDLIRAYAYSGLDPENENQRKFIDFLNKNGYKVVHKDIRKFGDGRVKANLDIELVVDLFRLAKRMDIAVIVSGDGDFAPAIRALQDEGVRCEVISFRPNTSSDLIAVADEFTDIMKIASIGRGTKEAAAARGMSAPEMPAKEVTPEFGFREASPSVAAAAMAALREGKDVQGGTRTGRGRGSRGRSTPPTEEPVAAAVMPTGNGERAEGEEGRRRRRRRGGRGRGRGGRPGEGEIAAVAPEQPGEIGWVELDDISQIDDLANVGPSADQADDEREYTFEEADEATLAELGLLDGEPPVLPLPATEVGEAATEVAEAEVAEAEVAAAPAAPRRRSRTRKTAATAAAGDEPAAKTASRRRTPKAPAEAAAGPANATEAKKPRARRTRSASAASSSTATAPNAEAKPARRSRAKKADAAPAGSEDIASTDTQGIWQRFRSARGGGTDS